MLSTWGSPLDGPWTRRPFIYISPHSPIIYHLLAARVVAACACHIIPRPWTVHSQCQSARCSHVSVSRANENWRLLVAADRPPPCTRLVPTYIDLCSGA